MVRSKQDYTLILLNRLKGPYRAEFLNDKRVTGMGGSALDTVSKALNDEGIIHKTVDVVEGNIKHGEITISNKEDQLKLDRLIEQQKGRQI